jgi:hypothetical protein
MKQVAGVSKGRSLNPILISAATFAVIRRHSSRARREVERGAVRLPFFEMSMLFRDGP